MNTFPLSDNLQYKTSPSEHNLPSRLDEMSQDSPLLAMAPELRNWIYRLVLVSDAAIDVSSESPATPPGLLGTCRQIREEATSIYYHENAFTAMTVTHAHAGYKRMISWFGKIDRARCAMMAVFRLNLDITQDVQAIGSEFMTDQAKNTFQRLARAMVHRLVVIGVPPNAIHFEAARKIVTLGDAIKATWCEAGERDVEERVAANGLLGGDDGGSGNSAQRVMERLSEGSCRRRRKTRKGVTKGRVDRVKEEYLKV